MDISNEQYKRIKEREEKEAVQKKLDEYNRKFIAAYQLIEKVQPDTPRLSHDEAIVMVVCGSVFRALGYDKLLPRYEQLAIADKIVKTVLPAFNDVWGQLKAHEQEHERQARGSGVGEPQQAVPVDSECLAESNTADHSDASAVEG